jgi:hypothetical protein
VRRNGATKRVKAGGELEPGKIGKEAQLAGLESGLKAVQEQPAEEFFEDRDGQEKPGTAGHPMTAVERGSAAGNDAMHMGMIVEVLPPGVEHRDGAELGAQMLGIGGNQAQVSAAALNSSP